MMNTKKITKTSKITQEEFLQRRNEFLKKLTKRLEIESMVLEDEAPDIMETEDGGLFDTPIVDSKSVLMLSPLVEQLTGISVKEEWIRQGGYDSVDEAIKDIMEQLELELELEKGQNYDKV